MSSLPFGRPAIKCVSLHGNQSSRGVPAPFRRGDTEIVCLLDVINYRHLWRHFAPRKYSIGITLSRGHYLSREYRSCSACQSVTRRQETVEWWFPSGPCTNLFPFAIFIHIRTANDIRQPRKVMNNPGHISLVDIFAEYQSVERWCGGNI